MQLLLISNARSQCVHNVKKKILASWTELVLNEKSDPLEWLVKLPRSQENNYFAFSIIHPKKNTMFMQIPIWFQFQ